MKSTKVQTGNKGFKYEWAASVRERGGIMLAPSTITKLVKDDYCSGFSSLYLFSPEDAAVINGQDNSQGFARFAPASRRLAIDLDNGDKELGKITDIIIEMGWRALIFSSGGKGYHVYLYHQWVHDKALPYSQRVFVEELGLDCDYSLYQAGRLLSLPGRIHRKTGKPKELVHRFSGDELKLPILPLPDKDPRHVTLAEAPDERLAWAFSKATELVANPPKPGNRHLAIWKLAQDLRGGGMDDETILGVALSINSTWKEAKSVEEIRSAALG